MSEHTKSRDQKTQVSEFEKMTNEEFLAAYDKEHLYISRAAFFLPRDKDYIQRMRVELLSRMNKKKK